MTLPIIDVDDPESWPSQVTENVRKHMEQFRGTTEITSDLALSPHDEDSFRGLFDARLLRAYHCTRLLPHEAQIIKKQGLRLLSRELVEERIDEAQKIRCISPSEARALHATHVFATQEQQNREGQVCLAVNSSNVVYTWHPGDRWF